MTFLNPIWLFALPLIALPILIHLLNQRRYRTIDWGAMQFLLSAKRMSKGMARLRQYLIMAARMLAIAGLIFTICRPLSSGWVGTLTGGKPETVIVVLDRSASMQQQQIETGETKLSSGKKKIVEALQVLGGNQPIVLIENSSTSPVEIENPNALLDLPLTSPTESQSDLAGMLESALDFVTDNQTGRTDIWICSDAGQNDWGPDSSRWNSLKSGFSELDGVRFHILNFSQPVEENLSVLVNRVERVTDNDKVELLIDLTIERKSQDLSRISVPVTFNVNGLRSVMNLEIDGETASLNGHRIPIDAELKVGWGSVEIPIDANASDNAYYFCFADRPVRKTVVVSESASRTRAMEMAAATTIQNGIKYSSSTMTPDQVGQIDWQETALLVWQAPLPTGTVAKQIQSFIDQGRVVLFLPPSDPDESQFNGVSWGQWQRAKGAGEPIDYWNNDADLLAKTRSGQSLPVNDLLFYRNCQLQGDFRVLAKLANEVPVLARRSSNAGAIYFLNTWPTATHSSLDREGVTLFAMIHRAISSGAESLGAAKQLEAGSVPAKVVETMPVVAPSVGDQSPVLAQARPLRAGVYGTDSQLVALNRPLAEDRTTPISVVEMNELFEGLDVQIVDDTLGSGQTLASEIWKVFLVLMGLALIVEAVLCMPSKTQPKTSIASESLSTRVAA